ncbi:MAG: outer membrane protein assembly factor BamB [Pseudomonadota bacterium]|nr:outer membrane protein assembly factor BamB [Pseudomonadota bacterium]MEC7075903.1 outer membrane protein assembly factor BamB [Pseudomonadota bacterium]MEC7149757.1 outer membrane protein assembly factor BamB [Pseudomonadota bacterium]MEC7493109.1 outer membrane protein assembly factor BamB [Pseudomonadota bacterium]MEC7516868.1 outer membrane protein assembly factor BamB [Pseudomonadota bacterium]
MKLFRLLTTSVLLLLISGCSTFQEWFGSEEEDATAPVELERIDTKVKLKKQWSIKIGDGQGDGFYKITPTLVDGVLYVASSDGEVAAISAADGGRLWRVELERPLSGGVGYHDRSLYLGGADGSVLQLSADDGVVEWEAAVSGEVLAAPAVSDDWVIVQTYDGKLLGFQPGADEPAWTFTSDVPILTLRGTSTPILVGDNAIAGFGDGKVVAVDVNSGNVSWESRIGVPQGSSEIDRIVDIDGAMTQQGIELFVASYQGRVAALDSRTGRKLWQQNVSSVTGTHVGFGNVYVADVDGTLSAFLRTGQGVRWQNIELGYRQLSRPTPVSSYVATVDFDGYLHLLSQVDGQIVGRTKIGGDAARADMIADSGRLFIFADNGQLLAYELETLD